MKRQFAINATPAEIRVAILEDGKLAELSVERAARDRTLGSIYMGRVVRVMPSMQAAFVDIGQDSDGFLPLDDARDVTRLLSEGEDAPLVQGRPGRGREGRLRPALKNDQLVPVQVVKEPMGTKGARLTMELSLAGRFLVLLPGESMIGVSRRIRSAAERRRLKTLAQEIRPAGFGLILRTVTEGHSESQIRRDLQELLDHWRITRSALLKNKPGELVHREPGMVSSVMRDLFTPDLDSVICDDRALYKETRAFVGEVLPDLKDKVELYSGREPLFDQLGIEEEIAKSIDRKVWVKGGGYLIIESTEAMISIDVNSGRYTRKSNLEDNALKVNLEAAREICRQLHLRDLGGLVVIDFIDMRKESNRLKVEQEMRGLLKQDKAQTDTAPISRFGLMEMTRERVRPALIHTLHEPCRRCGGTGLMPSRETLLTELERWIRRFKASTGERRLMIQLAPSLHAYLTAGRISLLKKMMWRHFMLLRCVPDERLDAGEFRCFSPRQGREVTAEFARGISSLRQAAAAEGAELPSDLDEWPIEGNESPEERSGLDS